MVAGATLIDTVGGTGEGGGMGVSDPVVPKEQLQKLDACAHSTTTPAHQASTRKREWRLLDTCMARAALVAWPPERDLVGSAPCCARAVAYSIGLGFLVYAHRSPLASEGTGSLVRAFRLGVLCSKTLEPIGDLRTFAALVGELGTSSEKGSR
jgi:hypothetical protein